MNREYHRWWSPALGRRMELLVFGHGGARVLVFPTSRGRFYEWEDRGMFGPHGLGHHIAQGWLQVFCVDSVDAESWYNYAAHPGHRGWRQTQYLNYVVGEVLPFSQAKNGNPFLIALGASFGAYHAVCFAFKFPHLVGRVIGMSGLYDIKRFTGGYSDDNVYFNNPMDFIQHEQEPGRLAALRRMDIILAVGPGRSAARRERAAERCPLGQGDRQRAAAVGRLGARLAILAAHAALLYRGA